ncbi:putative toxin-antitoxin system toxin component, PIN family [Mucilaginibacter sp. cycad4]|uniref:putative toxin-antitoxin system toxin component, PIN family n=1 Tax=Mucilaginibacter sp. cycad4 TaxID=3342096 RepID=UPI002AAAA427|nr:putative toxin-antitoxin system toxin component, PIN family [Mucilaginibacter gossypii]WPU99813.1 putative toxin-antitoxin system toxin component, PIN family [Mucilaginibacter gossypii]
MQSVIPGKLIKVILDTNLWISFLIRKDYSNLDTLLFNNHVKLVFSKELLDEFFEVAKRPKFRRYFTSVDIEDLIATIEEYAEFVEVKSTVEACRDKKDNFLLALAVDSDATYLLTGDLDLLDLGSFNDTTITTITDFFKSGIIS